MRSITGLACLGSVLLVSAAAAQDTWPLQVRVEPGTVLGTRDGAVLSWKGVPFAAPPVGALRWRAPQPPAHWTGVRPAAAYGPDCMQKPFPSDAAPLGVTPAEDCLYANVWRPAGARRNLPVVVWIYGGGFVNGGSSPATYAGSDLARQGTVFVSFNYRLGRFGTFAHPALTREHADAGMLANYGFMDQLAALRWVRTNVRAFGGDPANVTIMGESAGGYSVNNWLTSPLGAGLFRKAVVMSGGNGQFLGGPTDLASEERIGSVFGQSLGIPENDPAAAQRLRSLPAEAIVGELNMASMMRKGPRTYSAPFADGRIAVAPMSAFKAGAFRHVPVMIGATSGDIGGRTGPMIAGAREIAATLASKGVPVYHYRFAYVAAAQGNPKYGAPHASDIPYFMNTVAAKFGERTTPRDSAMARTVSSYLASFIRTGNPNSPGATSPGLPRWKRFDPVAQNVMMFTPDGTAEQVRDPWAQ